jgi:hypothetical protein
MILVVILSQLTMIVDVMFCYGELILHATK